MPNTIDYAENYQGTVIEAFKEASISDTMVNQEFSFVGAKTVKVYNVSTSQMNDYKRTGTSRYGEVEDLDATIEEMTMKQDRSFTFAIDKMDEDETKGALQAGTALARQLREVVIPEVDIYRYAKMAEKAGHVVKKDLTPENVYDEIITATATLDENETPMEGRFILATPETVKIFKKSEDIVMETEIGQEMRLRGVVGIIDGMEVKRVPSSRVPKGFNFLIGHRIATTAPVKLAEYKIHKDAPGISGSLVEGRIYYDAFVLEKRKACIYLNTAEATE